MVHRHERETAGAGGCRHVDSQQTSEMERCENDSSGKYVLHRGNESRSACRPAFSTGQGHDSGETFPVHEEALWN